MPPTALTRDDRAQAYTLEGFIGAMVVVLALLFALQAVVITPTSGGLADRTVQAQLQQEAQDALLVSSDGDEESMSLSEMTRYWDHTYRNGGPEKSGRYYNATQADNTYDADGFAHEGFLLGEILKERFANDGWSYNVELVTVEAEESERLVYQGHPPADAVTASYSVTLYETDTLTSPVDDADEITVRTALDDPDDPDDGYDPNYGYQIPPAEDTRDPVYNVVEVRLTIW